MVVTVRPPGSCTQRPLLCLAIGAAVVAAPAGAQTLDDGGLWFASIVQGRFAAPESDYGRLRWWLDLHERQRDEGRHFDVSIVRPGVGYALTDRLTVFAGYAWVLSDPAGRADFSEHRAWQQLTWNLPVEGFTLQSRTRLEERFFTRDGDTGWRLREFVKATLPLSRDHTWFASVWDEGFWDLNHTDLGQRQGFRQNRAFAGIGWSRDLRRSVSVEVGYLNQWIDRRGDDRMNHILSINLFMTF